MRAIMIDMLDAVILGNVETEKRKVDDMYYATNQGAIAIAYLFKPEHHHEIQAKLKKIREKREELRRYEYEVFNNFREFRI